MTRSMRTKILVPILALAATVTGVLAYGPLLFGGEASAQAPAPPPQTPSSAEGSGGVTPDGTPAARTPAVPAAPEGPASVATPEPATSGPKAHAAPAPPRAAPPPAKIAGGVTGPRRFAGPIDRSLYQTFAGRLPRKLADPLTAVTSRLLVWWLDPGRDLRRGDRIEVLYAPGEPEPRILALRFTSAKAGKTFEAYAFRPEANGHVRYFDAEGVEIEARLEHSPLDEYEQITSLLNDGRGHRGVDFKTPIGTPVRAPFDARISRVNWSTRRNGNCLDLAGPGGLHALFLHLDHMAEGIRPGRRVKRGTVVAYSGNTGHSTAPHLHYQLQRGRRVLDPFKVHRTEHRRLTGATLTAFQKERDRLRAELSTRR